jgi:8-oxo-dGTP diphosphatase
VKCGEEGALPAGSDESRQAHAARGFYRAGMEAQLGWGEPRTADSRRFFFRVLQSLLLLIPHSLTGCTQDLEQSAAMTARARRWLRGTVAAVLAAGASGSVQQAPFLYPRASVACILASCGASPPLTSRYLLIQRGNPPNAGQWTLPGGKLELGETTLFGAAREMQEEVGLPPHAITMHPRPISASDAILPADHGAPQFHYMIAQCFGWVGDEYLGLVTAGDDAAAARWFTLDEVRLLGGAMGFEITSLIELSISMHKAGLLVPPPTKPPTSSVVR